MGIERGVLMNLLLCVDGTKESVKALEKTIELVSGCRIDNVSLLHVYHKVDLPMMKDGSQHYDVEIMESYVQMNEELMKEHEQILEQAAEALRKKGVEPDLLLREGHTANTISKVAEDGNYDLIVMGSRKQSGPQQTWLGSVCNTVLQQTKVSVLVVK